MDKTEIMIGQKVKICKPYDVIPELAGKRGRVVAFEKPSASAVPWILVVFSMKDVVGLSLHNGRGRADRYVPEWYAGRCYFFPPCALIDNEV